MENSEKPTPEQIKEYEENMTRHYDNALPFLRKKAEYDGLQADISEARIRTLQADHAFQKYMLSKNDAENGKKVETEIPKE